MITIVLTSVLYFKYRMINFWMMVAEFLENIFSQYRQFNLFCDLILYSTILWIVVGLIIMKLKGRRNLVLILIMVISILVDVSSFITLFLTIS
mmetsp:Transcript_29752/g.28924  ORF Transcript_29752/g.28924 Transcript_29752/m.28924 type:complete len:93 (+) Transcript_29752:184-462(+)